MPIAPFRPAPGREFDARRTRLAIIAAVVGIGGALLAYAISPGVRTSVNHAVRRVLRISEHKAAPALPTQVLAGPRVDLRSLHGQRALVTFWAPSCAACGREAPQLRRLSLSAGARGRIVGVDYDESLAAAQRFVRRHRFTFPTLRDERGVVARRYGIKDPRGLPVTFVLDSSGHIIRTLRGREGEVALARELGPRR